MYEAEIKYAVDDPVRVTNVLEAKSSPVKEVYSDVYFVHPTVVPPMSDQELRVREISSKLGVRSLLTFKDAVVDSATLSKREFEVEIVDSASMYTMLEAMGFQRDIQFTKECVNWHLKADMDVLATLVTVPELTGSFLELETLVSSSSEVPGALERIRSLASEAGLGSQQETTATYTASVRNARQHL